MGQDGAAAAWRGILSRVQFSKPEPEQVDPLRGGYFYYARQDLKGPEFDCPRCDDGDFWIQVWPFDGVEHETRTTSDTESG